METNVKIKLIKLLPLILLQIYTYPMYTPADRERLATAAQSRAAQEIAARESAEAKEREAQAEIAAKELAEAKIHAQKQREARVLKKLEELKPVIRTEESRFNQYNHIVGKIIKYEDPETNTNASKFFWTANRIAKSPARTAHVLNRPIAESGRKEVLAGDVAKREYDKLKNRYEQQRLIDKIRLDSLD